MASKTFSTLPCLKCGATDSIWLNVWDLTTVKCDSCEEEMSLDDVKATISVWTSLLKWVEAAPKS